MSVNSFPECIKIGGFRCGGQDFIHIASGTGIKTQRRTDLTMFEIHKPFPGDIQQPTGKTDESGTIQFCFDDHIFTRSNGIHAAEPDPVIATAFPLDEHRFFLIFRDFLTPIKNHAEFHIVTHFVLNGIFVCCQHEFHFADIQPPRFLYRSFFCRSFCRRSQNISRGESSQHRRCCHCMKPFHFYLHVPVP